MKKKSTKLKKFNLRKFKFKGFTLIELLAVIVILAIIALIATPIVLNSIENAQEGAAERTTENYIDAVETKVASTLLNGNKLQGTYTIQEDGNLCPEGTTCNDDTEIKIDMGGKKPNSGTIVIEKGQVTNESIIEVGDYTVSYDSEKESYVATKDGVDNNEETDTSEPIPEPESFSTDSWDTIAKNVKAGNLTKYKVGDTREITLTGEVAGTYTLRIANTSTPSECSTSGFSQTACGFVIEFEDIITLRTVNNTDTSAGGWEASKMRIYVNSTILNSLPINLKKVIINTKVVSGHDANDLTNFTTTDKLYLFSTKEIWGSNLSSDTANTETRQLDYYKTKGVTTIYSSEAKKQYNGSNDYRAYWWLRSTSSYDVDLFFRVDNSGNYGKGIANYSYGVSPAFRIG